MLRALARRALSRLGLLERAQLVRGSWGQLRPGTAWREVRYRLLGAPDGQPLPPPRLIHLVVGHGLVGPYFEHGRAIVSGMLEHLRAAGIDSARLERVLDFGCGSGRLLRHWRAATAAELHGTDINETLIGWCRRKLPFGRFQVNHLLPPLESPAAFFDFAYAQSVFTHMSEGAQQLWLDEFARVISGGGHFLFTTHGDAFAGRLDAPSRQTLRAQGIVVIVHGGEGSNEFGTFQTADHTRRLIPTTFRLVLHVPGQAGASPVQDVWLLQRTGEREGA